MSHLPLWTKQMEPRRRDQGYWSILPSLIIGAPQRCPQTATIRRHVQAVRAGFRKLCPYNSQRAPDQGHTRIRTQPCEIQQLLVVDQAQSISARLMGIRPDQLLAQTSSARLRADAANKHLPFTPNSIGHLQLHNTVRANLMLCPGHKPRQWMIVGATQGQLTTRILACLRLGTAACLRLVTAMITHQTWLVLDNRLPFRMRRMARHFPFSQMVHSRVNLGRARRNFHSSLAKCL